MKPYLTLLRPHQYVKNLFIFMPLFFGLKFGNANLLIISTAVFAAFCLISSSVYIFNDVKDMDADRLHPEKRSRPLASGEADAKKAMGLSIGLMAGGFLLASAAGLDTLKIALCYVALNIAYTLWVKNVAIMDITFISMGFVLRLFAGSMATGVPLSEWIIVTTFLLSLFLALAKRRDDVLIYFRDGQMTRKTVDGYSIEFLNTAMAITATIVLIAYLMYTLSPEVRGRLHSDKLYLTNIFVLLGIFRYLQLTYMEGKSGNPAKVALTDQFIQLVIGGWMFAFIWILYL